MWRVEWSRLIGPFGCGMTAFSGPLDFAAAWRECRRVLAEERERVPGSLVTMVDDSLPQYRMPEVA
jgi:hypothetical protein